jgi:hypothetical protein
VLCYQEPETIEHLTVQCAFSRQIWFELLAPYNLQHLAPSADSTVATWWQALSEAVPWRGRKELNTFVVLMAMHFGLRGTQGFLIVPLSCLGNCASGSWKSSSPVFLIFFLS